jgi:hypothetical protein
MELILTMSTGLSGRNPVESPEYRALEKRRAWDRDRQARKRAAKKKPDKESTKSGGNPPESTGQSGGFVEDFLKMEVIEEGLSVKKENKKGSRLSIGTPMTEQQREAAIECGCPPDRVESLWVEFVDYWSEIPGQKGLKLSWLGTWRNRVKWILANQRNGSGGKTSNALGGFSGLSAKLRQAVAEEDAEFGNYAGSAEASHRR